MPIDRNTAQYITGNPQQPTQSSAPGIWDIDEQGSAQAAGRWPLPPNVVQRSLRFNSADSAYLSRTPATASNRKTWTWSGWVKLSAFSAARRLFSARVGLTGDQTFIQAASDNTLLIGGNSGGYELRTTAVYRDPSAWYHIVLAFDTTQATSSNRIQLYVNGSQVTALQTATYPSLNLDTFVNATNPHSLGAETGVPSEFLNGYMAEVNFVDGQALTPSSFGQTDAQTGQWIPRVYSGSYGTNGFRLQFLDNSGTTATTLGKDTSGLGNNWTPNNFSVAAGSGNDSLRDVPMNYYSPDNGLGGEVIGNYCTWNPINPTYNTAQVTISNGNLQVTKASSTIDWRLFGTFAIPSSGQWYWEATITAASFGDGFTFIGIADTQFGSGAFGTYFTNGSFYLQTGNKSSSAASSGTSYGSSYTTNDVVGIAYDATAGTITFYKNGVSQGVAYSSISSATTWFPAFAQSGNPSSSTTNWNFGQRPFAYTAPSGFKCLCTQNLSAPRIGNVAVAQANDYFNTVLYTGTGSSLSVTGTGFQPDLVWIKSRSAATDHALYDAVRGVQNQLESNTTTAETAETTGLTAFGADGFTVGSLAQVNTNAATYVAWQWNAGGSTVTNTSGTITSTVRASQTAGFSVVRYTGTGSSASFGHGLGTTPQIVIIKSLGIEDWFFYAGGILGGSPPNYLKLNTTSAAGPSSSIFPSLATSSVVNIGGGSGVGANGVNHVAYCFAAVPGFSAFGSYTGNSSADGPFLYCGFRPRMLIIKCSSAASTNWIIVDTVTNTYNVATNYLLPNASNAELTDLAVDFLSNGFKVKVAGGTGINLSGSTYIYAAFAEIPFQFANAR